MAGFFDKNTLQNIIDYSLIIGLLGFVGYFIYSLIMANRDKNSIVKPPPFDDTPNASQRAQLSAIEGTATSSVIKNASFSATNDNALRHYFIKASSNSAYTGG